MAACRRKAFLGTALQGMLGRAGTPLRLCLPSPAQPFCPVWAFKTLPRTLSARVVLCDQEISGPGWRDWSNENCKGWTSCLPMTGVSSASKSRCVRLPAARHGIQAGFLCDVPAPQHRTLSSTGGSYSHYSFLPSAYWGMKQQTGSCLSLQET